MMWQSRTIERNYLWLIILLAILTKKKLVQSVFVVSATKSHLNQDCINRSLKFHNLKRRFYVWSQILCSFNRINIHSVYPKCKVELVNTGWHNWRKCCGIYENCHVVRSLQKKYLKQSNQKLFCLTTKYGQGWCICGAESLTVLTIAWSRGLVSTPLMIPHQSIFRPLKTSRKIVP